MSAPLLKFIVWNDPRQTRSNEKEIVLNNEISDVTPNTERPERSSPTPALLSGTSIDPFERRQ